MFTDVDFYNANEYILRHAIGDDLQWSPIQFNCYDYSKTPLFYKIDQETITGFSFKSRERNYHTPIKFEKISFNFKEHIPFFDQKITGCKGFILFDSTNTIMPFDKIDATHGGPFHFEFKRYQNVFDDIETIEITNQKELHLKKYGSMMYFSRNYENINSNKIFNLKRNKNFILFYDESGLKYALQH